MDLDQEWKHMLKPVAALDLTPGNGFMAEVCAVDSVPYIGICLTQEHAKGLHARLTERLFAAMACYPNHKLHQPSLATRLDD